MKRNEEVERLKSERVSVFRSLAREFFSLFSSSAPSLSYRLSRRLLRLPSLRRVRLGPLGGRAKGGGRRRGSVGVVVVRRSSSRSSSSSSVAPKQNLSPSPSSAAAHRPRHRHPQGLARLGRGRGPLVAEAGGARDADGSGVVSFAVVLPLGERGRLARVERRLLLPLPSSAPAPALAASDSPSVGGLIILGSSSSSCRGKRSSAGHPEEVKKRGEAAKKSCCGLGRGEEEKRRE